MMVANDALLTLDHLTIGYNSSNRKGVVVAGYLNGSLSEGELVCLLGPNGVGKSTLIRTIAGMQAPLEGHVWLSGRDVSRMDVAERAREIGVVLTDRVDGGMLTGYGLVALGRHPYTDWTGRLSDDDEDIIRWAVSAVDADEIAHRRIDELSDGERQKIMIARALAQEPSLILLDEPTAFLDLPRRIEIMQLLRELAHRSGRSILVSTHDLDLALRSADRLWLFSEDRTIESGVPEDLVLNGAFERVFYHTDIQFNRDNGSFQSKQSPEDTILLVGEGAALVWTERALERIGFAVTHDEYENVLMQVRVIPDGEACLWELSADSQTMQCASIQELLSELLKFRSSEPA